MLSVSEKNYAVKRPYNICNFFLNFGVKCISVSFLFTQIAALTL